MQTLRCGEIWGGTDEADCDLCSGGITASLFSSSAEARRGGDVYYLSVCGRDELTRIALADATGHGRAAEEVGDWLYGALESRVNDADERRVLEDLNEMALVRGTRSIATVALASFAVSAGSARFAYAGHSPALVLRAGEREWQPARLAPPEACQPNAPIGVLPGARYDQREDRLGPGDRLFLYTDGLVEGRDVGGQILGEERLHQVLAAHADASLGDLKAGVLEALRAHSPKAFSQDDVSLVAVEVHPS